MTQQDTIQTDEKTYCAVHPDRETSLRCNKCGRLMCVDCAVLTPVGYRCRECVRGIQDKFFTATQTDYALLFVVTATAAGVLGALVGAIRIPLLFVLILGLPVGGALAELSLRTIGRRRGRYSPQIAAGAAALGALAGASIQTYLALNERLAQLAARAGQPAPALPLDLVFTQTVSDLGLLTFIIMITVAVYGRYRMRI
jgi:multisubunit Na+/H+ antiporter MnhC subunit